MWTLTRVVKCVAAVALVALIAACGNNNNNSAPTNLRFVNATQGATLSVTLNQTGQFSNVAARTATSYAQVTPANYAVSVTSSSGTLATATQTVGLASGQTYTLLAYERDGAIVALLVVENQSTPASGYATFEASNSSPDCGNLDVYVVSPGASLSGLSPVFSGINFGSLPAASSLVAGTYDIVATAAGDPTDIRSRLSSVVVSNEQILMTAYTSTSGGALVDSVLLTQGGSVSFSPTTQARVRIASALPQSGSTPVAATVGSASFATVFSPNPGSYTPVTGGTSTYSVTVNGTAVAMLPAATFAVGGDFTILVYGTSASSPLVAVFTDNNQTPASGNANLRLINASATNSGGLTMYYNGKEAAISIGYGTASAYVPVVPFSLGSLELIESSVAPQNFTLTTSSGSVYTVFVIDTTTAGSWTVVPIKDR
jgi:predicted transcriptional regulator